MEDVVVLQPLFQMADCPESEGEGLRVSHGGDTEPLHEVHRIPEFLKAGGPEKGLGVVEIQSFHGNEAGAAFQQGIRGTGQYVYLMSQFTEGFGKVSDINALAAGVGVAPVADHADA
jgi:hypothetical protein